MNIVFKQKTFYITGIVVYVEAIIQWKMVVRLIELQTIRITFVPLVGEELLRYIHPYKEEMNTPQYPSKQYKADDIPGRIKEKRIKKERMNILIKKAFQTPMDQLKMKARGKK